MTAWVRSRAPSLSSTLRTCVFTVSRLRYSESAISALDSPPATSRRTSASRPVSSGRAEAPRTRDDARCVRPRRVQDHGYAGEADQMPMTHPPRPRGYRDTAPPWRRVLLYPQYCGTSRWSAYLEVRMTRGRRSAKRATKGSGLQDPASEGSERTLTPSPTHREKRIDGRLVLASAGNHLPSIYVPLIHGIGGKDAETWAGGSADPLVRWWHSQRADQSQVLELKCAPTCEQGPYHRHLLATLNGQSTQILIDPVFWTDKVSRPSRARSFFLVLRAGLFLGLIDLAAAARRGTLRIFDRVGKDTGLRTLAIFAGHGLGFTAGLVARAFGILLLTMPAALAVLASSRLHRLVGDALAWTAGDRSRNQILSFVRSRTSAVGFDGIVLVGHSQGGSIIATLTADLPANSSTRVVTLGSGHALLEALNSIGRKWGIWRSLLLWFALALYLSGVAFVMGSTVYLALQLLALALTAILNLGGGWWLLGSGSTTSERLALNGMAGSLRAFEELLRTPWLDPLVWQVAIAGFVVTALGRTLFGRERLDTLLRKIKLDAAGVDIIATHDPVPAVLLAVGDLRRTRLVSQCASLTLDHTKYFHNGSTVLPIILEQIEATTGKHESPADPARDSPTESLHKSGLTARRWMRPVVVFLLPAFAVGPFVRHLPTALVIVLTLAAVGWGSWLVRAACERWMERMTLLRCFSRDYVARYEGARTRRRSGWWCLALLSVAIPVMGASALPALLPAGAPGTLLPQSIAALSAPATLVAVLLIISALLALQGSRWGNSIAVLALGCAVMLWLSQATLWGVLNACSVALLEVWAIRRALAINDPRPLTSE
jgi:hypothetical protein